MPSTQLMSLSNDLLLCIIDALKATKAREEDTEESHPGQGLIQLSSTCKRLRLLTTSRAFRVIRVSEEWNGSGERHVQQMRFMRALEDSEMMQTCIQSLELNFESYSLTSRCSVEAHRVFEALASLEKLHDLVLRMDWDVSLKMEFEFEGLGTPFEHVTRLTTCEHGLWLIPLCPSLVDYTLDGGEEYSDVVPSTRFATWLAEIAQGCPSLKSLGFRRIRWYKGLPAIADAFPELEVLDIRQGSCRFVELASGLKHFKKLRTIRTKTAYQFGRPRLRDIPGDANALRDAYEGWARRYMGEKHCAQLCATRWFEACPSLTVVEFGKDETPDRFVAHRDDKQKIQRLDCTRFDATRGPQSRDPAQRQSSFDVWISGLVGRHYANMLDADK